ncbi:MAG: metalloregulator ArsR/SmtB family transcription factor [Thermoplasmatales archaeon]|nr:metalloregulator ArsR/SmtB family transcription factor [Thermoplasmatales archaeon]
MDNNNLFKALGSESRIKILKKLVNKEFHLSQLSRDLKISKPVISRHIKILEKAGLVKRRVIGNVHLLSCNIEPLENAFEPFIEESNIKMEKDSTIFDAIKQLPGIETVTDGKNKYIASIDGEKGYYIYEVDGKAPEKPIDKYKPQGDVTVKLKKLVPVEKKKIKISFKEKKKK